MSRQENIRVFESALEVARKNKTKWPVPSIVYTRVPKASIALNPAPIIRVENVNCITALIEAKRKYKRVAILNMASYYKPGGGVANGANAQEEFLCRISNMYPALQGGRYPLINGFVVKDVTFFRDEDYEPMAHFQADVITISAPKFHDLYKQLTREQLLQVRTRVEELLNLCIGYDAIVLSAFGCGAYNNPARVVAETFSHFLIDAGMAKYFKEIVFAILNDRNSTADNVRTFSEVLLKPPQAKA